MTAAELLRGCACGAPGCECARGRRRTHCPVPNHRDRRPSLDVDERAGRVLVICRAGCRQAEVLEALRARGLWPSSPAPSAPRPPRSLLEEVRQQVLAEAGQQGWARSGILAMYHRADLLRCLDRTVVLSRRVGTALGPIDHAWDLLDAAAGLERVRLLEDGELLA